MARQSLSLSKATHKLFIGVYYILLAFIIIGMVGWAASTAQSNTESFASIETGSFPPAGGSSITVRMSLGDMEAKGEAIWELTVDGSVLKLYHDGNGNWELINVSGGWRARSDTSFNGISYDPGGDKWIVDVNDLVYEIPSTRGISYKVTSWSNLKVLLSLIDIVVVATTLINAAVGFLLIFKGVRLTGVRL